MLEYRLNRREAGAACHQDAGSGTLYASRFRHPCARDAQGCASVAGGRMPGATGTSTSLYVVAQKECAERPFEAQQRLFLHFSKNMVRKMTAGDMANVDLQKSIIMRGVGQRKTAPAAVAQQNIDILPGQKLQALVLRQF